MNLIRNGQLVSHDWKFLSADQDLDPVGNQIITEEQLAQFDPEEIKQKRPGLLIQSDSDLEQLVPAVRHFRLIVIEFPVHSDGRGFSLAYRLRHSFGFEGEIWGMGQLISDQYVQAVQCGMDAVLIDDQLLKRQPIEQWNKALELSPDPYRFDRQFVPGDEPASTI